MNLAMYLTIIIFTVIASTNAQITFSRDWFAGSGKRSDPQLKLNKYYDEYMANRGLIRPGGTAKKWKPMTSVGVKRSLAMSGLGPNNDNRIQDVSRAIEYLQNLQYELLSEDADVLDKSMPADNNEKR